MEPYDPGSGVVNIWPDDYWTVDDPTTMTGKKLHIIPGDNFILPGDGATFGSVFTDLSLLDGFGTTAGMEVQLSVQIDPMTLPATGDGSAVPTASVLLMDLDADPPVLLNNETVLDPESKDDLSSTLVLTASLPLRPKGHYGLAVTNRLRDINGACVTPSPVMQSLLDGSATDPKLTRLVPRYQDFIQKLVAMGAITSAADLTAASVFTTQHTVDDSATIATNIKTVPIAYTSLGPCTADPSGNYRVCEGMMSSYDYRAGHMYVDENDLTKHDAWQVPVTTYLPMQASTGPIPTIIFGHGLGGSRHQAADLATFTGPKNLAVVAIDAVKHGDSPDKATGTDLIDTVASFFGLSIANATIDTRELRDNFRESTYDKLQVVEMLRPGLDIDGDGNKDVDLTKLMYLGVSLGGIMSAEFLAFAPDTQLAIPIVPGARVTDIIQYSKMLSGVTTLIKGTATEGEVSRTFPFVQTAIDRGDAGAYTQHIVTQRLPGFDARVPQTLMQMVIDDDTVPNVCNRFFARGLGVPLVGDELQHVGTIPHQQMLPTMGNLDATHTGGLFQYDVVWDTSTPCCDLTMGKLMMATHSNVGANPITIDQTLEFVESYLSSGLSTILDPYRDLKVKP
jgi:pimeloyl-ACP methyl ester carboxylesterase